ncbi:MAG TPA: hypothetical protein DCS88_09355 [Alphaproteobacteria bacterium]|nr:hypothetical protein [Alphaproteobacteria bacterium]
MGRKQSHGHLKEKVGLVNQPDNHNKKNKTLEDECKSLLDKLASTDEAQDWALASKGGRLIVGSGNFTKDFNSMAAIAAEMAGKRLSMVGFPVGDVFALTLTTQEGAVFYIRRINVEPKTLYLVCLTTGRPPEKAMDSACEDIQRLMEAKADSVSAEFIPGQDLDTE